MSQLKNNVPHINQQCSLVNRKKKKRGDTSKRNNSLICFVDNDKKNTKQILQMNKHTMYPYRLFNHYDTFWHNYTLGLKQLQKRCNYSMNVVILFHFFHLLDMCLD